VTISIAIDSILHPCHRVVPPNTPLRSALSILPQLRWPILPIATGSPRLGSLTSADGVRAIAQVDDWGDTVTVADFLSQAVISVPSTGQLNVFTVMQQMRAQASCHLLAQDEQGELLGVIGLERLWAEWAVTDMFQAHTLADLLPLPMLRLAPITPCRQVAALMAAHPGHCSVVMSLANAPLPPERSGAAPVDVPLGMITPEALCQEPVDAPRTAATLMTPIPLTLPSQASLADVWSILQREASPITVVTQTGEWVGVVTALDLLRVFTPECLYQRVQALERSLTVQTAALAQERADRSQIEARFHEITSLISQVFFIRSITGEFLYISPAYESLWGRSREHLYQHPEDWLNAVHPEDLEAVQASLRDQFNGQAVKREYRIMQPDGSIRWIQARISTVKAPDSQVLRFIGVADDITDRKQVELALQENENFLRSIYEHVHDGIFVVDVLPDGDLRYVSINPAQSRLLGISTEDFQGQTPEQIFPPTAAAWVRQQYQYCIAVGTSITYEELVPFQGKEYWWQTSLTPLKDPKGRIYRLVGTCANITDIKQTEAALRESLQEKKVLLAEVHHRVKNNLQIVSSLLSLQAHRVQDQIAYEALAESRNRISTMALIHEHLYRSENLTHIRFENYVKRLVTSIFTSYSPLAQPINFEILIDPEAILHLEQSVALGLILNELITNALQHAFLAGQPGKITIQLQTNMADLFTLIVWDNGRGLPTDFVCDEIQSMGLKLVQTLASQLLGKLEIQPRNPTLFKITFPPK